MLIDNSDVVIKDRKILYLSAIGLIIIICFFLFADVFDEPVFGLSREVYIIIACVIYIATNIYWFLLDLNYFYYNDEGDKLIFKYYSLRPFMQKRCTVEIPKNTLMKFTISSSMFGNKKSLVLFQRIKNNTAKYPPISISALSNQELHDLEASLNSFTR
jgi:hypothetical protein